MPKNNSPVTLFTVTSIYPPGLPSPMLVMKPIIFPYFNNNFIGLWDTTTCNQNQTLPNGGACTLGVKI